LESIFKRTNTRESHSIQGGTDMSDENNEMLLLLKELVNKVKTLEDAVYNKDNLLMKSGFVVVDSPSPSMQTDNNQMSGDKIAKMDWSDIHNIIETIEG
tara:strand:+ start:495 stop:791 length:297 start_codon:yes stop_codon:yes gene_type:complete